MMGTFHSNHLNKSFKTFKTFKRIINHIHTRVLAAAADRRTENGKKERKKEYSNQPYELMMMNDDER
jgi:hypothetical protein